MKEEIVNKLYAAYGTDSGILFGIKERSIVEAIVDFTLNSLGYHTSSMYHTSSIKKLIYEKNRRCVK